MSQDIRRSSSSSSSRKVDRYFPGRMPPIHTSEKRVTDIDPSSRDPRLRGERKSQGRKHLKSLRVPKYEWNSDSVGDPPLGRIMLQDIPELVPLSVVTTAIARFGTIDRVEIIRDDDAAPLPLATVVFKGAMGYKCAKSAAAAKEVRIMDKTAKIILDLDGNISRQIRQQLIDIHTKLKMPAPKGPRIEREKELQKEREKVREKELEVMKEREREKRATADKYPSSARLRSPIRGISLTPRMREQIRDDPFAFISDRYLPSYGRDAPRTEEVFRFVRPFRPDAVLRDQYGWYVVFTKSRYCQDCIYELDGVRFLGYRVKMEEGNRPRPHSQPHDTRHDDSLPTAKADRYGRQYDENKIVSKVDGEGSSKEAQSKSAYDIIMAELNKVLTAEIQQRVINREIYDVLKENMNKERQRRDAELEKEREIASKQLAARREATKTKQLKLSKPLRLLSEEKDENNDKESEASTRMTTPVVSSPAEHHSEYRPSKRRAIRDFSSSGSESDEPEPKRQKSKGIEEDFAMEVDEEDSANHMSMPLPEPAEVTVVEGQAWAPKSGEKPTRIVEDPDGPYTTLQILNMIKDEEDLKHLKMASEGLDAADIGNAESFVYNKRQVFGGMQPHEFTSFKSRGYVKIPEVEKDSYLLHRIQKKAMPVQALVDTGEEEVKVSSRGNRVNARREEKQFTENFDVLSINKLKKRKKPVEFRRSAIHDWGLYAMEQIPQGDMIIEYVGEVIRSSLQDTRERTYQRSGIGSSYLFHVDNTQVIDATKRGGIARFINHSCDPSCLAKVIQMQGTSRIVIYAAKDVGRGEELTYDYKFEREEGEDRVPCLCGSAKCKGWLN